MRIIMLGAREMRVSRRRSCREKATSWPLCGFLMVRSMKGTPVFVGGAGIPMVPGVDMPGNGGVWASTLGETVIKRINTRHILNFFNHEPHELVL